MADENKPVFDPNQPHEIVGQDNKPSFDPNQPSEPIQFAPTTEDEYGTRGMQRKALGLATQVGEHALPFGVIPKAYAGLKSLGNDKSYAENKSDVRNSLNDIEEPAGLPGKAAGLATELVTGPGIFNMAKNAVGLGSAASESSSILNAIKNSNLTNGQRALNALPSIAKSGTEGAMIGGVGGALESDHPSEIIPNTIEGGKFGGELGLGTGVLGNLTSDTGIAKKFGKSFDMGTQGEKTFGMPSNIRTGNQVINTSEQVADQMMNPLKVSGDLYKAELKRATDIGNIVNPSVGLKQASGDIIQDIPTKKITDYHKSLMAGTLSPVDAKDYQNIVNSYLKDSLNSPVKNQTTIERLKTLKDGLNNAIDKTLPADRLAKINQIYKGSRQGLETYLNEGIQNPSAQLESISDYAPGELRAQLVNKIRGDTIPNSMRINPSSASPVQTTLANYMGSANDQQNSLNKIIQGIADEEKNIAQNPKSLEDIYKNANINYHVPESIRAIEDAGTRMAVTGSTGSHYQGENGPVAKIGAAAVNPIKGGSALLATPYKIANVAGLATSPLRSVANNLQNSKFSAVGKALNDALDNPGSNAKNAILMKIMQSPEIRKTLGININSDQENK